jgi:hypothetical protein
VRFEGATTSLFAWLSKSFVDRPARRRGWIFVIENSFLRIKKLKKKKGCEFFSSFSIGNGIASVGNTQRERVLQSLGHLKGVENREI